MNPPDVSIVIPTFNRADLLGAAIDSGLSQSHPCEVIVVDHGSSDHTADVVAGYGDKIRYVRKDKDDGPFLAWLDGVLHANGEFIHFTFDDDWIAPDFVARCMEAVTDDIGIVFTDAMLVSGDEQSRLDLGETIPAGVPPTSMLLQRVLTTRFAISPGCALLRRKDALDALMMNPVIPVGAYHGVGPDMMLYLVPAIRYPKFAYIAEPLAFFRWHPGSITADAFADPARKDALIHGHREYQDFFRLAMLQGHPLARRLALALSKFFTWTAAPARDRSRDLLKP